MADRVEVRVVMNPAGVRALLNDPAIAAAMHRGADAIASAAAAAAGSHTVTSTVDGEEVQTQVPVEMRRTSFDTGQPLDDAPRSRSRARSAVLVSHPTATGREAGMRALLSSLDAAKAAL